MTHVWQYQNNVLDPRVSAVAAWVKAGFNYDKAYSYKLDRGKDLLDYNLEQQAVMLTDYFNAREDGHGSHDQSDADRLQVLQKFIANPSYAFTVNRTKEDLAIGWIAARTATPWIFRF